MGGCCSKDESATPSQKYKYDGVSPSSTGEALKKTKNSSCEDLIVVTMCGDVAKLKGVLSEMSESDITSAADKSSRSALHCAASVGDIEAVDLLLSHKFDVNAASPKNNMRTALHEAVFAGVIELCERLLAAGSDVNAETADGETPLMLAAALPTDDAALCEVLLKAGAAVDKTGSGRTALWIAANAGNVRAVKVLLEHGADIESTDASGCTPLFTAANFSRVAVVHQLLESGAAVDAPSVDEVTPLAIACFQRSVEVVEALLNAGANLTPDGVAPIDKAVSGGRVEIVRFLLSHGVEATPQLAWKGLAASFSGGEMLSLLLEFGVDLVNSRREDGKTLLHEAALTGNEEAVEVLIEAGMSVSVRDKEGRTPIFDAVLRQEIGVVNLLVGKHRANINEIDNQGDTPLTVLNSTRSSFSTSLFRQKLEQLGAK